MLKTYRLYTLVLQFTCVVCHWGRIHQPATWISHRRTCWERNLVLLPSRADTCHHQARRLR